MWVKVRRYSFSKQWTVSVYDNISLNDEEQEVVNKIRYLGTLISKDDRGKAKAVSSLAKEKN